MALSISNESYDPGNTVAAMHPVFDFLTTFNDLQIENVSTSIYFKRKLENQRIQWQQ